MFKRFIGGFTLLLIAVTALLPMASSASARDSRGGQATAPAQIVQNPTRGMINARRQAKNYLSVMPFSLKSLKEQLRFEGYTAPQVKYGVHFWVDWNKQAARQAKNYLNTMPFSRSDLIQQLEYEGYTPSQALYGVNRTGL